MKRISLSKLILCAGLAVCLAMGCSRDPNVRKQKYFESGQSYFQKQKYREASIQFQNAIQIDSSFADAHYQLAQCLLNLRDGIGAYRELLRVVELAPENLKAQIDLGNMDLAGGQFDRSRDRADAVLQRDPNNVDAHILRANALARLHDVEKSLLEMQTVIALAPEQPRSYLNLALVQLAANQPAAAQESFKKALSLDPKLVPAHLALASLYAQDHQWSEAEAEVRQAVSLEPKNLAPRVALCELFLAQGQIPKAEQAAKEARDTLSDMPEGYRLLGDLYFRLGEIPKALDEYASLYQAHPKDARVKVNYIQLLILQGRLDEAKKLNDEILKANPRDTDGVIARGQILIRQGHAADALNPLQGIVKAAPDNAVAHYNLGLALDATGDSIRAEQEWREAVRLNPALTGPQRALANVALRKGDFDLLRSAADAIVSGEPNSPDGYVMRALARAARRDPTGAETDLKKAIEIAPQSPLGYVKLAELRASQKKFTESQQLFEQALEREPNSAEALGNLVALFQQQNQPAKALARVDLQISKVPQNPAYYILQAQLLADQKQFDKAETAVQKALDLNKADAGALFLLAQIEIKRGVPEKAIESYQRALQQNPNDANSYFALGVLEEGRNNWQKAQELYQKALQIQSDFPLASNNLAYLMLEHGGNADVALSLAQTARQRLPDSPSTADTLAWAYYNKGLYKLAIDLLEDAAKKVPNNPTYHYHLGLAYQKVNDKTQAKAHLERALQLDPKSGHAAEISKALLDLSQR